MAKTRSNSCGQARRKINADESESEWEETEENDKEDGNYEVKPPNTNPRAPASKIRRDNVTPVRNTPKLAAKRARKNSSVALSESSEDDADLLPTSLRKTAKGGYSHTKKSKARIGKANKGNTPWNKGRNRSEADKAKIAAGVRARNRAVLLEKLKKFNISEEEYHAKSKEIKKLREKVRKLKMKNKEQQDLSKLQIKLNAAVAERDKVKNANTGPVKKEDFLAIQKEEEEKIISSARSKTEREANRRMTEMINSPLRYWQKMKSLTTEQRSAMATEKEDEVTSMMEEENIKVTTNVPNVLPPARIWKMKWTPSDFDERHSDTEMKANSSYPKCPNLGFGGLICCEKCSDSYSSLLQQTVQDMEERRLEAVVDQAKELLGYVEDARIRLLRSTQAAEQKSQPEHLRKLTAAEFATKNSARKKSSNKAASVSAGKEIERNSASAMEWAVTSTLDMSAWEPTSARI